jgi:anti-sigma B factor antagonist
MATSQVFVRGGAERSTTGGSSAPAPFRIVAHTERDVVRICPLGEVDLETVGRIREQIEKLAGSAPQCLVLDLRGATFLESAGLNFILEADAASRESGWELEIIGGPARVQRVFELTGSRARLPFLTAAQLSALLAAQGDVTA